MALFKIEPAKMSLTNLEYFAAVPDSVDTGSITASSPVNGKIITANKIPKPTKAPGIIDVYGTFDWTTSPINNAGFKNISKTPFAKLTEYRMNDTSIINSMLYYVKALGDQIGTIGSAAKNAVPAPVNDLVGAAAAPVNNFVGAAAAPVNNFVGAAANSKFGSKVKNLAASVVDAVVGENLKQFVEQQLKSSDSPWMKPYDGLYSLEQTSFTYFLPYFENDAFNRIESTYVEASFPGLERIKEVRDNTTTFSRILAPGQYIETPKMFALNDGNSPRITIKFPLLNTLSFEGAVKNYQLLWLLAFQNTPQRVNKSVVELPRMYDVHIPGVTFMKFAYIESMHVDFIGVRRRITIPMPTCPNNDPQAEVIMPDAYNVTITLRSTIMNANNMMLENWRNSKPQS